MTTSGSFFTFFRPAYNRRIEHNVKAKVYFKRKEIFRLRTKIRRNAKISLKLFFKKQFEHLSLKRNGQELLAM